jgi:signal transduction histidine kinase
MEDAPPLAARPDTSALAPSATLAQTQAALAETQAQLQALLLENQELQAARQELAASEARLKAAEAVAGIGSYELDLLSGAFHFSEGLYRLFGEVPYSFRPSLEWLDARTNPQDVAAVRHTLDQALADRQPYHYSRRIRRADGQWRFTESHGQVVCNAAGVPIRLEGVVEDKTKEHEAAQELFKAKERLRITLDSTLFVVQAFEAVRDEAGHIVDFTWVFANKAWTEQYGEPVGKRVLEENPGVVTSGLFEKFVQVTQTGVPIDHECYYHHEQFDSWFHQTLVKMGDGFVMHTEDISARKQAEQALQTSRELLRATLDSSPNMVQVFEAVRDAQGEIVDFAWVLNNRVSEESYGDVIGHRLLTHNPGVVEAGIFDTFKQVVETGRPDQQERHYTGEQFDGWFHQSIVKLHDGVATTTVDITERKQAEQELLQNLRLLEQSEQVADLGSWVYELATGELRWSAGMYRLFGLAPGTALQPTIYLDHAVADDRPVAERVVQALTTAPTDFEETLRLRVGQQVRTLRLKAVLVRDAAGQPLHLLGVDLDISRVHQLEADNLRLRLRQQQALFEAVQEAQEEERRRIAESLHNGIGQLLYATKLHLDRLPNTPELAPRQEAARLLSEAIRQTRELSHELTPALLEEFGLEATLLSIGRSLNTPTLRWHYHIVIGEEPPLPGLLQLAVYRMAQELAQNVLKHAHATEATLEVEVLASWIVLRVEDNGRGFDPTRTSDGLGLRTLRSRVALLGGEMHVASAPGQGAQCFIRLPLPSSHTPPARA